MQKIEEIALSKLILDENYCRQVLPFVKEEYFDTINHNAPDCNDSANGFKKS